jgi:voltage-gated potassium channel
MNAPAGHLPLRRRVFLMLDEEHDGLESRLANGAILAAIVASVLALILDTDANLHNRLGPLFAWIERIAVGLFTVEYALRVWSIPEARDARFADSIGGRLRWAITPMALVDLLAILPFYLGAFLLRDLLLLRLVRLIRILKIARYAAALRLLREVLAQEARSILGALLVMAVLLIFASSVMYALERSAQPDVFGSIPQAMWWGVVTLTTLGYGDAVPITALGRLFGGVVAVLGVGMFALPAAILGAGFVRQLGRRQFLITTARVGRLPLFAALTPGQLAEVTALLRARRYPPRYTLMRRGEAAEAMYFIDDGQLEVQAGHASVTLGPGDFVGEQALLEGGPRQITAITLTECRLLELDADDLHRLLAGNPEMRNRLVAASKERPRVAF